MELSDKELEDIVRTGRHVEITLWDELDYRGVVVAFNREAIQVPGGHWYIRRVAKVRAI